MAYTKIIFQNSPSTATPLNAQNLNHMDDQIALNDQRLTELEGAHVSSFNGRTGAVTPADGDYDIGQIAPLTGAQVGQVPVVTNIGTEEDPELVFRMGAGGGAGGHEIIDSEGHTMPQESAMQFADSFVSDDDVNGKTVIENIKEHSTKADYDDATEDGFHVIDDGEDAVIHPSSDDYVEVTADGNTTYATLLNAIYSDSKFDISKVNECVTTLKIGASIFHLFGISGNESYFSAASLNSQLPATEEIRVSSSSYYNRYRQGQFSDLSSTKPSSGTKVTLYYGNKKATVDLQTTANRCLMSDGVTSVEGLFKTVEYTIENDTVRHDYAYPTGFTRANCIFINAKIFTKYDSWVDTSYADGNYWGELSYVSNTEFGYLAHIAGNATKIQFTFMKLVP